MPARGRPPELDDTSPAPRDERRGSHPQVSAPGAPGRHRLLLVVAAAVVALATAGLLLRGHLPGQQDAPPPPAPVAADYPFGPASAWRTDVSRAPVAADSAQQVAGLVQQVTQHWGGIASFNVDQFTASWYTAAAGQATTDVAWVDCQHKGYQPDGLTGEDGLLTDVPIPAGARPSPGGDGQLTVYSPSLDRLWEFWQAKQVDGRWQACWGGRMDHVSTNVGVFPPGFGASASGLAMSAGTVWVDDARAGRINHALGLAVLQPAAWPRFSWPANRTDGGNPDPHALAEGTRLRLDPDLDLDGLQLTPIARMVAVAAQRYGFIVTDTAGAVNVGAQLGQPLEDDPDFWTRRLQGVPSYQVLRGFPWEHLQALPHDYGKPADAG